MSWNLRDYRTKGKTTPEGAPPPAPVYDDTLPLPTFAGMEDWDEDASPPGWWTQELKAQGLMTPKELDRFAWVQRRGIDPLHEAEPPPAQRPSLLQRLLPWRTPAEPEVDEERPPWKPRSAHEAPPGARPGGGPQW